MATPDYGVDVDCVEDLDPAFGLVSGNKAVAQALLRRFSTPRGGLFYDRTYGYDLRAFCNADLHAHELFAIAASVEAEAERDERVSSARADVTFDAPTGRLRVSLRVVGSEGPFALVLDVSAVTVELLTVN